MVSKDIRTDESLSYDGIADELMTTTSRARARTRARGILARMTLVDSTSDRKSPRTIESQQSEVSGLD